MVTTPVPRLDCTKAILVADDDRSFLDSLVDGLRDHPQFGIHCAGNGKEALRILEHTPIHMVLTDLKMPQMDGFELVTHLRNHHPQVPIMVMTAFGTPEMEANLRVLGVTHYIEKPIDLADLCRSMTDVLERGGTGTKVELAAPAVGDILHILCDARTAQHDGELIIRHGQECGRVFFHHGKVAWITATTVTQTLVTHIAASTKVTLQELKDVFEECKRSHANFAETLVKWGLLNEDTVRQLLLEHIALALSHVLSWSSTQQMLVPDKRSFHSSLLFDVDQVWREAMRLCESLNRSTSPESQHPLLQATGGASPKGCEPAGLDSPVLPAPPQPLPALTAVRRETEVTMNIGKLNKAIEVLKQTLGDGLNASDVWTRHDGMSIAGFNSQPVATALFNRMTDGLQSTLVDSGFPALGKYYLLELANEMMVVVLQAAEIRAGILVDKKKAPLGVIISVALPKFLASLEEAVKAP